MIRYEKLPADILRRLGDASEALKADPRVVFAYLFGGCARGQINPLSDIDIAVYLAGDNAVAEHRLALFDKLSDVLGTSEIDLVVLNTAPVSIAGRALQGRRILVDKEPFRRHRYESLILREYFDFSKREADLLKLRYGVGR